MTSDLAHARAILAANNVAAEGSFMHAIHEREFFDKEAFWRLYDAMAVIAATPPRRRGRNTRKNAARVQREILLHVIYHLNPRDGGRIAGFPTGDLHLWLERVGWVFDPVVLGVTGYGPARFDDDLRPSADES
ncbi:hypothetical protein [Pseudorhodoplanes sinuspersici]|uniref:Uncharacterized protein n=1 Tax=Pseudorhodoplanes sinuspersici TaxID=1235591 RepID=A0A1W6ZMH4_9HYPH|nr:hypothetical protein [Pseudorhodoplanes sinuspersici]ARP97974.1 hypothetical protein CAK95_01935 [Pseudorhodoplanes sinuspersici]RKE68275.1 immunity protein 41 of polymorphic toxin system [Pseudorhodoplanes sinuspersici]